MSAKPSLDERGDAGGIELTPAELEAEFDREARERLGITAAEFRQRWESGLYAHLTPDDDKDVWMLSFYVGGWGPGS